MALIDVDKMISGMQAVLDEKPQDKGTPAYCAFEAIIERLKEEPTVDAVEVVRCKECKHWKPSGSKAGNSFSDMEYIGGCEFTNYCRRESDFCSYGEKRHDKDGTT